MVLLSGLFDCPLKKIIREINVIIKKNAVRTITSVKSNPGFVFFVIMKPADRMLIPTRISKRIFLVSGFTYLIKSLIVI